MVPAGGSLELTIPLSEGTGTYTEFSLDDGQGTLTDSTSGDPANANRIRGIGKPADFKQPTDPVIANFLNPVIDLKNPRFKQLE